MPAHANEKRKFHSPARIASLLEAVDEIRPYLVDPRVLEIAVWFYECGGALDGMIPIESIVEARTFLSSTLGVTDVVIASVIQMIFAPTRSDLCSPPCFDIEMFCDITRLYLGLPRDRFMESEANLLCEFSEEMSHEIFFIARRAKLRDLIAKKNIFQTYYFWIRCEGRARENISYALSSMESLLCA